MRYLLAIEPPAHLASYFQHIQDKYASERWTRKMGPHITLVQPFELSDQEDILRQKLSQTAHTLSFFTINTNDVNVFNGKKSVIYAEVLATVQLSQLQRSLRQAVSESLQNSLTWMDAFHPHLTLSNWLTTEEVANRLEKITQEIKPQSFQCTHFNLYISKDGIWEIIESYPLGHTVP